MLQLALLLLAAEPQFDVFTDRGELFVRAGTKDGLKVGIELQLVPAGKATVMEVWDKLARIAPDEAGKKAKAALLPAPSAPPAVAAPEPAKPDAGGGCPDVPGVEPISAHWSMRDDEFTARCCGTTVKVLAHETALGAAIKLYVDGKLVDERDYPTGSDLWLKGKNVSLKVVMGRGGGDYSLKVGGKPCQLTKQ